MHNTFRRDWFSVEIPRDGLHAHITERAMVSVSHQTPRSQITKSSKSGLPSLASFCQRVIRNMKYPEHESPLATAKLANLAFEADGGTLSDAKNIGQLPLQAK